MSSHHLSNTAQRARQATEQTSGLCPHGGYSQMKERDIYQILLYRWTHASKVWKHRYHFLFYQIKDVYVDMICSHLCFQASGTPCVIIDCVKQKLGGCLTEILRMRILEY